MSLFGDFKKRCMSSRRRIALTLAAVSLAAFFLCLASVQELFGFSRGGQSLVQRSLARFISDPPKEIHYPKKSYSFEYGVDIGTIEPVVSGGTATQFAIHPALPKGVKFDFKTGVLSGMPEHFLENPVSFTVTASNRVGSTSARFEIREIRAPKPRVAFAQRSLVLNVGDSIDVPIESLAGPYEWVRFYPEKNLPKGLRYDANQRRLVGRVEATNGFTFLYPTKAFFLRAKGFRSYSETALNITLNIPQTPENREYSGSCLNVMDLLRQMKSSYSLNDMLFETVATIDGAERWVPSPSFMATAIERFRLDRPTELYRKVSRGQWLRDFGYEVHQLGCNTVYLRRSGDMKWVVYNVDDYHSGTKGIQEIEQEHRVSLVRVTVAPHFPEKLDFVRVTRIPADDNKQPRDYLVIRAEIQPKQLEQRTRCDGNERIENYKIRISKTVQLGILRGRGHRRFAEGGPAINKVWFAGMRKIRDQSPELSCRWINY